MSHDPASPPTQRRKFRRINVRTPLDSTDLATGRPVILRNLSHGGFQTLAPTPGATGMKHVFRVRLDDGRVYDLRAAVIYSQRVDDPSRSYLVGWQALPDPATLDGLAQLFEYVTSESTARAHATATPTRPAKLPRTNDQE